MQSDHKPIYARMFLNNKRRQRKHGNRICFCDSIPFEALLLNRLFTE